MTPLQNLSFQLSRVFSPKSVSSRAFPRLIHHADATAAELRPAVCFEKPRDFCPAGFEEMSPVPVRKRLLSQSGSSPPFTPSISCSCSLPDRRPASCQWGERRPECFVHDFWARIGFDPQRQRSRTRTRTSTSTRRWRRARWDSKIPRAIGTSGRSFGSASSPSARVNRTRR
jgi:hypothetical protein